MMVRLWHLAVGVLLACGQFSQAITNRKHSGSVYLNQQRPLWVLEDQVEQRDATYVHYARSTTPPKPRYYNNYWHQRPLTQQMSPQRPTLSPWGGVYKSPRRIQLPSHYIWTRAQNRSGVFSSTRHPQTRREQYAIPTATAMPTFDSAPGSESPAYTPIFIYNGPKGELIFNTVLSARRYPMQEPVPGETLYPPTAPIFRPKPIVERFHVPGQSQPVNLTLIPFYAHEAFDPRVAALPTHFDDPPAPTVLYAAPVEQTSTEAPTTTIFPTKKRRLKKAKQYSVYRSPNEVHWQPPAAAELQLVAAPTIAPTTTTTTPTPTPSNIPTTTPFPMALASPLQNHRYTNDMMDAVAATTPQAQPLAANFRLTYKDDEDQFQIVYIDESLERPTTSATPTTERPRRLSSHYAMSNQYYAFPVFTLGKLLNPQSGAVRTSGVDEATVNWPREARPTTDAADTNTSTEADTNTWFILNSRYKGRYNPTGKRRLSSKYVQNSASNSPTSTLEPLRDHNDQLS